ncbi:Flavin-containing monooxygenase [Rhynchospora pubera]|uniref:Flavin-containing monooxygenase n=1 Tax=Rhynchospora pubera TaxID=906938 RepID=A0AAV8HMT8_9POAL|nr:Flavin-containing monooxygenase [Rhynchospora pubera]
MRRSCKVAVIGGGMSGLVAARELLRESHQITVFEKSHRVGGTWVYDPCVESDPLGLDPHRAKVHGSLYASLRTNLMRPLMGFSDYPFTGCDFGDTSELKFPRHEEVLHFLEAFAADSGLMGFVKFGAEVVKVKRTSPDDELSASWMVKWVQGHQENIEHFEAVVICNGHYSEPRLPQIPGIDRWPGKQVHSHNYRTPEPYLNQVIVIVGKGPSGFDISVDVANAAKEVHIASRSLRFKAGKIRGMENIFEHEVVSHVDPDGRVNFADGFSVLADIILYCTGYSYHFPFLEINNLTVDDNRVGPLYKHVFSPRYGPYLSFVGITSATIVFLTSELQSKWISQVLSGKCTLPSENEMMSSVKEMYDEMEEAGKPKHRTHWLYDKMEGYLDWLAAETGLPQIERWWFHMFDALLKSFISFGHGFRGKLEKMSYSNLLNEVK